MNEPSQPNQNEWLAQERALELLRRYASGRCALPGDQQPDPLSPTASSGGCTDTNTIGEYRLLFHALTQMPRSEPPDDFAAAVARAVRDAQVDEHIERWVTRVAGAVATVCLAVFAGPILVDSLRTSDALTLLPGVGLLGSPLLWAAAAGTACAVLLDALHKVH